MISFTLEFSINNVLNIQIETGKMLAKTTISLIIAISIVVSAIIIFSTYEYEEIVTVTTTDHVEITTTSSPEDPVSTFTVPLKSGNFLECTKTTSINCISPNSRKILNRKKHYVKNSSLRETSVVVSIKKKYNQPIIYYNFPNSCSKLSYSLFIVSLLIIVQL